MFRLGWQRRLEHGDVTQIARRAGGRNDSGLNSAYICQVVGRTRGQPQGRRVVPWRNYRKSRVVLALDRTTGSGGAQDPTSKALATTAADVRHALTQASVQREKEHGVHESVNVRYVKRYLEKMFIS